MQSHRFSSSEEVFGYLMGFVNVEKGQKTEFKLDRMRWLCSSLGDPQKSYRTIHVAGSKGKGSVSVMIARILQASGLKVGLYTSPHLLRWKERISLAGDEISEDLVISAMEEILPLVDGKSAAAFPGAELPTYFELTTLVAFCAFRRAGCEIAVVETGLGGRLDSTNVVDSEASVITPIELEHTEWLGDSLAKIAYEKAGIIKPGKPCFLSPQVPEAREVFRRICAERGSPLRELDDVVSLREVLVDRSGTTASLAFSEDWPPARSENGGPMTLRLRTPIIGKIQAQNMALAVLSSLQARPGLGREDIVEGLSRAKLPARFQILDLEPPVVLDGAHTPSSVRSALESLRALFPGPKQLLFACAIDKHHEELAELLAPHFEAITVTRPGDFKQSDAGRVYKSFASRLPSSVLIEDFREAIRSAREESRASGRTLLITGSFYLCAEAAKLL